MRNLPFKVAILDMYDGFENQGMRSIQDILNDFSQAQQLQLEYKVYNIRGASEAPDLSYDAYISTGGPGSPLESQGSNWEAVFFEFIQSLRKHNQSSAENKKPLFLICHSFQVFCRHYGLAKVKKRKSTSFGIFPIHKTVEGDSENFLEALANPFWAVDSRDYQVVEVNYDKMAEFGASILCREKIRPHIPLERAVMAVRFTDYIFGTQFHPEADPSGMLHYFSIPEKSRQVVEKHGQEKLNNMLQHLHDYDHIMLTRNTIIPCFLKSALEFKLVLQDG